MSAGERTAATCAGAADRPQLGPGSVDLGLLMCCYCLVARMEYFTVLCTDHFNSTVFSRVQHSTNINTVLQAT